MTKNYRKALGNKIHEVAHGDKESFNKDGTTTSYNAFMSNMLNAGSLVCSGVALSIATSPVVVNPVARAAIALIPLGLAAGLETAVRVNNRRQSLENAPGFGGPAG